MTTQEYLDLHEGDLFKAAVDFVCDQHCIEGQPLKASVIRATWLFELDSELEAKVEDFVEGLL